ncbi:GNAT family N-acetyltransferase [Sorangium sp. So ce1153]|uniref:GNAT family N-acetyltransferase n=1 Tax=Sorangium sp. So ce1153 TaxID=3133333 RepID=UPI003F5F22AE
MYISGYVEEHGFAPPTTLTADPRASLAERVTEGQEYLIEHGGAIVLSVSIGVVTPEVVTIESVYIPPEVRGQGWGLHGLRALCRRLLEAHECIALKVRSSNTRAIRLYQKLGFIKRMDSCLLYRASR